MEKLDFYAEFRYFHTDESCSGNYHQLLSAAFDRSVLSTHLN